MVKPDWDFWGHKIDDPIWPNSIIWLMDNPAVARCTDCCVQSRVADFQPFFGDGGYERRKECPVCYAPGFIINEEFIVIDTGGKIWRTKP